MRVDPATAAEWRSNWRTVFAALAGFSVVSVATSSMSLFIEPLSLEFGWSRATVTAGLLIFAAIGVPLSPWAGSLVDRWGARAIAIPGILLSTACFAAFSLANGSVLQWLALWTIYSLAEVLIKSYVWATAVSNLFSAGRGLAVAITLCGGAIAQTFSPLIAQFLIDGYGWRAAYISLGLGWGGTALVVVFFFFDDGCGARSRIRAAAQAAAPQLQKLTGFTFAQAMRDPAIQIITTVTVLQTFLISSTAMHTVPILSEIGITRGYGAVMASLAGISAIAGKLVTGHVLDRSHSRLIGQLALALPAISYLMLLPANVHDDGLIVSSMALIGFSGGASLQIVTYWTARYAGLRSFGATYGVMTSAMALSTGVGPVLVAALFDQFGSYRPFIIAGIPMSLVCSLLAMKLGSYPSWDVHEDVADLPDNISG